MVVERLHASSIGNSDSPGTHPSCTASFQEAPSGRRPMIGLRPLSRIFNDCARPYECYNLFNVDDQFIPERRIRLQRISHS